MPRKKNKTEIDRHGTTLYIGGSKLARQDPATDRGYKMVGSPIPGDQLK
jgi:hypothetical protein